MKNSKKLICLAVAASLAMGAAFAGCTVTNNEEDAKQTVVVVNISKSARFAEEFEGYEAAITDKTYTKRDMLISYYNGYSSLSQSQSLADIFDSIKDNYVKSSVITQYATVSLLKDKVDGGNGTLAEYTALSSEVEKCEYLLSDSPEAVKRAKYTINNTLNSVLDSAERELLEEKDDDEYVGSGTRSTPTGIDATVEDYVTDEYNVYTGYNGYLLEDAGEDYEPLDNTNKVTRQKAYSAFIKNLGKNYLINAEDEKETDIWKLSYVQDAYVSQLQSEIVDAYNDKLVEKQKEIIDTVDESGEYGYIRDQYESAFESQKTDYDSASSFESAMGSMSDSRFILYSPDTESTTEQIGGNYGTFGFVYNILLPFSKTQEAQLKTYQTYRDNDTITESGYYKARNDIMKNIKTTDQRSAWFNGSTNYSFKASETELDYFGKGDGRDYLFFENNVTDTENKQYKALEKYDGRYSYNGTVKENTDGSYTLIPEKLDIDDMLEEFSAYINYVLGGEKVEYTLTENYYDVTDFTKPDDDKEIDYSLLVYASGKVNLSEKSVEDMLVTDKEHMTDRYKAMCAVNELQYAYTTDTGVLSQYIGYSVSAYDTSYIKEFEYAAQAAVREGVGSFKVCAGDYGWHLIYVTETFNTAGGAVYAPHFTEERVNTEGTFENRFYTWKKDAALAKEVSLNQETVLKEYNSEKSVSVFKDVYKDISGL